MFQQQFLEIITIAVCSNNDFNDDHMRGDNDSVVYIFVGHNYLWFWWTGIAHCEMMRKGV